MIHAEISSLLDYHYWARDRMLDALEPITPEQFSRDWRSSFPSIQQTVVHIYGAEWLWHARWTGNSPTALPGAEQFPDVPTLRTSWEKLEVEVRNFAKSLTPEGLNRVIEYKMLKGQLVTSPFWQMVQHVVNHATYHRGQLTTMLRQGEMAPPKNMDVITFYRERPR